MCISNGYFVIFSQNQEKMSKNVWKELCFKLLFKAGQHANAGRLSEGVPQNCLSWKWKNERGLILQGNKNKDWK